MSEKKLKLLYDASFVSFLLDKSAKRSGIFFAAYNIYRELLKKDDIELTIYCNYRRYWYLKDVLAKCKWLDKNGTIKLISSVNPILSYCTYLNFISQKRHDIKDNFAKKVARFITYRAFKIYDKFATCDRSFETKIKDFDVCLSPFDIFPMEIRKNKKLKRFLFLHDAIPIIMKNLYGEECFNDFKWFYDIVETINKQDYYFADSISTRNDFIKYVPNINPENIEVTYLGANENFYHEENIEKINKVKAKYNIPLDKKYNFSLCSLEPRKNLIFAIKNFIEFIKKNNIDDFVFVLGGGHWDKFLALLEKEINDLDDYKDKILKIGYVDDEDLAALFSGAEMFVYPSVYEGFGMPVLEAMQCGCPVITSNVSSLPEVIGNAGIQIDPYKNEELVEAYEKMYFDENFRKECSQKGLERAKNFSWEKCVNKVLAVIKSKI